MVTDICCIATLTYDMHVSLLVGTDTITGTISSS